MELTYTLEQLPDIANQLLNIGKNYSVWAFNAPMGAGKTTLIAELCRNMGIKDAISSPTYSIINEYHSADVKSICHMDWYRLKGEEEAMRTGVEDALYTHSLSFVEWPDIARNLLPDNTLYINISIVDNQTRVIKINKGHL